MSALSLPLERLLLLSSRVVGEVIRGRSLSRLLPAVDAAARPAVQALAFDVLRHWGTAKAVREHLAPKAPAPAVDVLLITALALLVPEGRRAYADHTLVDQAVAAVRRRRSGAASFANAVLRRFLRERDACLAAARANPEGEFNHPRWWIERLQRDWPGHWRALLAAADRRAPMTLRVNARRSTGAAYLARLRDAGLAGVLLSDPRLGGQSIVLDAPCPLQRLPGFAEGDVSVQDAAAQLAAPLLLGAAALRPRSRVLDACAAPGGKAAHLLELADVDLLALDADRERLMRIRETLARLHLRARVAHADARHPSQWWDGKPFDAIMLDAPCTASGIVRRHPDVRWLRRESDIAALAGTQDDLLAALWPLLAPGGVLLFATCSVFQAEGEERIDAFLQRHRLQPVVRATASPGHLLPLADNEPQAASVLSAHDGFFYALIHEPSG
jgi:16S rRNA (cytosine967-C5)-methyltransferase